MRRGLIMAAAGALLLVSGAAQAGLRAVYIDVRQAKQLQIDIHDNGDARIAEIGSDDYGLLIGGEFYIVDVEGGKATVARLKDVATAIDKVLPPIFKGLFDQAAEARPKVQLVIEPGEPGSAGGRDGRVYHVKGLDSTNPNKPTDYLISADPDLKPVGAALEQFMNAAIVPSAPLIGSMATELIGETRTIFALGTPIDVGGRFRLNLAGKAAFPGAYFRLPAQPQSVESLVKSMQESMAKKGE
jgi:hypothetical protein